MKNMKAFILTIFMCGLMSIPAVHADEQQGSKHEGMHKKSHEMFKQLNLTEDQKKQIDANKQKQREEMKAVFTQMKSQREALHQELMKKDLDMTAINNIQAQIKASQAQMADHHLNSILEVRKILTPEQFTKFLSLMEDHKSKRHEHKGQGPDSKDEKSK